jgi:hypothetical protein
VTATRYPTREAVLACVDGEWQTTHAIFRAWLGRDDNDLPRSVRDAMRRDVFYILDTLLVMRAVEKRQVSDVKCEWRRA